MENVEKLPQQIEVRGGKVHNLMTPSQKEAVI